MGALVAAAVVISAVNEVHDDTTDHYYTYDGERIEYEHRDSYTGAAAWLTLLTISAIIYHALGIVVRLIYFTSRVLPSIFGFAIYALVVSVQYNTYNIYRSYSIS